VVSVPSGAAVSIAGQQVGTTPWMAKRERSVDALTVTLRLAGYDDDTFALTPDADKVLQRDLKPLPKAPPKPKAAAPKKRDQVDELMP
jgi:hypothetical protein